MKSTGNPVEASLSKATAKATQSVDLAETPLSKSESVLLLGAFFTLAASLMSFTTL